MSLKAPDKTVLICEDSRELFDVLCHVLAKEHFRVFHADTLRTTKFKLSNQKFDVLIMDLRLKDGTTEKLIYDLKSQAGEINYHTPIVVMSGHLDESLLSVIRAKISTALVKPFSTDTLVTRVLDAYKKRTRLAA